MYNISEWDHVFKLDPNKMITDTDLQRVCTSGTDAVIVGGTDGVTFEKVTELQERLESFDAVCVLEVSDLEAIAPGFDAYFIPLVMNSNHKKWMMDVQHQAIKEYGDVINWKDMLTEGYCVLNPEAKVFQRTDCSLPDKHDVLAYAQMAEHIFRLPVFYMEYSGTFGDRGLIKEVAKQLEETTLVYGGGIRSEEQAEEMAELADVIVVGDVIYDNLEVALKTVKAVKSTKMKDGGPS
ncbi:heptaprenylglyceryl phosphate synthase [Halobacillus karajensis]|uniref:Heptaprenylglyceryl phosphate synthase n=1 Tax=Halobacillus karajensis TaxID=195088 RepID=A0A024P4C3_9BACI|nr:heptaprenylglyceryl phosphate synthase [Halobacillus karajensis]CDQ20611.1 Heptaprenylglyceryl phosphate synthase [Halobacillus karajensis]CDQ23919.1 Heptaprenylglyceryl phosphate synthase [Halobacillus karajensis]CDQ27397.1 Heptaprenylglyceryl phosphate synthase [Halobacillus karajensis]